MLFLGCLFRKEEEKEILRLSKGRVSNASNTFQWSLINGLNEIISLDIINVLPVGTYPKHYNKLFLKTKKWAFQKNRNNLEIGSINLPVFKQWLRYKKTKNEIELRFFSDKKLSNIIIYSAYLPFLKAVYKLDRRVNVTLIVTDLPEYYDLSKVGVIRKIARKINNFFIYKYLSRVDSFVLLTERMKNPLKIGNRPYCVVEGIIDTENLDDNKSCAISSNTYKKTILYSGTLHYRYGIKNLLNAFKLIENNDYELWICGSGEAENEIKSMSSEDKRIKFFGFLIKDDVKKLQQQATILVNPRPNEGEYTKYSFPSKIMEYLASGRPVLMNKLDGIPDEYDEFIYYFNSLKPKSIASKIVEVMEKEEERKQLAEYARQFVLNNKNSVVQARKVLEMLDK